MASQTAIDAKLGDLSEDGQVVESRLSDPRHALRMCQRLVNDDSLRAERRSKIQGSFNGDAPKNAAKLVRAGRAMDSNLNFKRMRGHISNAWTPFFDMVCEVPVCIDGDLTIGDAAQDSELMRGFAEYFHKMMFGWRGFDDMSQLCDLQMLLHGPGVLAWEDALDWRPKAILADNFYVPDETAASLDNCEQLMIYTPMRSGDLWRKIKNESQAPGWDVEAVKEVIMSSGKTGGALTNQRWGEWDRAFKNGDLYVSSELSNVIRLYTLFVQEMDGTISQKLLTAKEDAGKELKYLFESTSRYECWDQVVCMFPYDIGADGTFHSIKGLGTDIYPFCALLNSIDNSIADLVVSSIKPMWQPATNAKMEDFKMARWGGGNFVPNGINPLQIDMSRGIQPAMEVSRGFSQTLTQNTAASIQDMAAPTVEETAKSAMIRAAERAKVSKGLHNRYMRGKDRQYAETWRRAINPKLREYHPGAKEALEFQRKCKRLCAKLGVDWEVQLGADDSPTGKAGKFTVLQLVQNIRANRSLGLGSAAMRIEIADQLMANIDRFDEVGKNEILRKWTSVMTNYHDVDAIVPSLTTGRDTTNDEAVAAQENNSMAALGMQAEVFVVPTQDHVLHLGIHVPSMEKDMEACQQGQLDPRECFDRNEAKGKHSNEHLAILEGNPTRQREAKEFAARLAQLAAFQDQLQQNIEEQDKAAAEQPQEGEITPEMAKVQGNLELKAQKDEGQRALKEQQQAFNQQLKAQDAEFNRRISDLEAAAKINRENALTQAKTTQPKE